VNEEAVAHWGAVTPNKKKSSVLFFLLGNSPASEFYMPNEIKKRSK
jgi:hypothetical protein